jgi:hypothetical protein
LRKTILEEPQTHFAVKYLFYDRSSPYPDVCLDPAYPRELRDLVEIEGQPPRGLKRPRNATEP